MKNYTKSGDVIEFTAPRALTSGEGVQIGSMFLVATNDVANGAVGVGKRCGTVTIAKATGNAFIAGARVFWDDSGPDCNPTGSGFLFIGLSEAAAASGDTTMSVVLTASPGVADPV